MKSLVYRESIFHFFGWLKTDLRLHAHSQWLRKPSGHRLPIRSFILVKGVNEVQFACLTFQRTQGTDMGES